MAKLLYEVVHEASYGYGENTFITFGIYDNLRDALKVLALSIEKGSHNRATCIYERVLGETIAIDDWGDKLSQVIYSVLDNVVVRYTRFDQKRERSYFSGTIDQFRNNKYCFKFNNYKKLIFEFDHNFKYELDFDFPVATEHESEFNLFLSKENLTDEQLKECYKPQWNESIDYIETGL